MNITDVGHLTSDADAGDDKMMKALERENLDVTKESMLKLAEKYTKHFKDSLNKLNIQDPDIWCKATEHIPQMVSMIEKIKENGFTYDSDSAVYFDISKDQHYGELARLKLEDQEAGARVQIDKEKKNPQDFVLWFKAVGKHKNHLMQWDSKFSKGFPGWHIECSAMSSHYLGEQFDIHTGGEDLAQTHHINEIAQAEAAFKKHPWVRYWMHGAFLVLDKEKMSKSKGDFLILDTLEEKGYDPLVYRYFCLGTHYRKQLTFSYDGLDSARNGLHRLQNKVLELLQRPDVGDKDAETYIEDFQTAINDDVNMPKALAAAWNMLKDPKVNNTIKYDKLLEFDRVLGLRLDQIKEVKVTKDLALLLEKREHARLNKHWDDADKIRDEIQKKGYIIDDTPSGPVIKKA